MPDHLLVRRDSRRHPGAIKVGEIICDLICRVVTECPIFRMLKSTMRNNAVRITWSKKIASFML
jgi:hypothetical protein